jgi:hypothetical protein
MGPTFLFPIHGWHRYRMVVMAGCGWVREHKNLLFLSVNVTRMWSIWYIVIVPLVFMGLVILCSSKGPAFLYTSSYNVCNVFYSLFRKTSRDCFRLKGLQAKAQHFCLKREIVKEALT